MLACSKYSVQRFKASGWLEAASHRGTPVFPDRTGIYVESRVFFFSFSFVFQKTHTPTSDQCMIDGEWTAGVRHQRIIPPIPHPSRTIRLLCTHSSVAPDRTSLVTCEIIGYNLCYEVLLHQSPVNRPGYRRDDNGAVGGCGPPRRSPVVAFCT